MILSCVLAAVLTLPFPALLGAFLRHGEARMVVLRVEAARARINSLLPACGNKCAFAGRRRRHGPACGDASLGAQRTCFDKAPIA